MAGFADNDVQKLLQQAEERLSGGRIIPKQASTASTTAKPVGEDTKVLPPKQEKTQVRVPRPQVAASEQRKGKVRTKIFIFLFSLFLSPSFPWEDSWYKDES